LIVDDSATVGRSVARILRRSYETCLVLSVAEAQARLVEEAFDFVVSDVMMPERTGVDLHRWLAEQQPQLVDRLLLMTGGAPREIREYIEEHRIPCLEKPLLNEDLLTHLRRQGCPPHG
jgi:DNA-binding NtrC family response regulator